MQIRFCFESRFENYLFHFIVYQLSYYIRVMFLYVGLLQCALGLSRTKGESPKDFYNAKPRENPDVRSFVCSFVIPSRVKVLRQSFSSGVYLSNYLSESIHIWTIVTLEGWHSLHDPGPQGPCPGMGLEVKI